ncbi:MAG: hypothetical protein V3S17_03275 [candidate division Zixibacteria bacterium]
MRNQISKLFVILLSLFLALSCEKEVPLAPAKPVTIESFPDRLGSQWTYYMVDNLQIIDSSKPDIIIDTVEASIDKTIDPSTDTETTVWRYLINNQDIIVRPVFFNEDTVYIYWNWENRSRIGLVFPFGKGDRWRTGGFLSGDVTTVTDVITATIPGSLFENVFVLQNKIRTTVSTDSRTITLWYVPNLGFIKIHLHEEHAQSVGDTTWTLVDHNFPGFN